MSTSTKRYIFGVRIYLDSAETQDTDIGLYVTNFGSTDSQFDITNPSGTTFRYTWDGTGTDPNFVDNQMVVGDKVVINSSTFNAANNGTFTVAAVDNSYFEIINASGVAEANKVLSAANSIKSAHRFRWIQNSPGSTTTDTWKAGMFAENGIGNIPWGSDFTLGGNTALAKSTEIAVKNAIGTTPFWKKLVNAGISLKGLICEIVEIDTETAHGGTRANETLLFRGACVSPSGWNEGEYRIPVEPTHYKRIANITEKIDNDATNGNYPDADDSDVGKAVPVTFGEIDRAKFVRTKRTDSTWGTTPATFLASDIQLDVREDTYGPTVENTVFPVVGDDSASPPIQFQIKIGITAYWYYLATGTIYTTGVLTLTNLVGMYLHVTEGNGSGELREVSAATVDLDVDATILKITVTDYFKNTPTGNSTATHNTQTWVSIKSAERAFTADQWSCKAYLDVDGAEITTGLNLFAYDAEKHVTVSGSAETVSLKELPVDFKRLPQYAYEDSGSGDKNTIDLDVKLFDSDPDTMDSFIVKPMKSVLFFSGASTVYNNTLYTYRNYGVTSQQPIVFTSFPTIAQLQNILNNDKDSYARWELGYNVSSPDITAISIGLEFELPTFPDEFEFDSCYLMLWIDSNFTYVQDDSKAYFRKFIGTATQIYDSNSGNPADLLIRDTPDFYFAVTPNTKNKFFYVSNTALENHCGYANFELSGITEKNKYQSIHRIGVFVYGQLTYLAFNTATVDFYKAGMIFKKSVSIKEAIYSPMRGRIYNSTWATRKTAADLMTSPIDIYEHVARLQDWKETGDTEDFGKEYSPNALINTGATEGGFDWAGEDLEPIRNYKAARQILDYNDCYTDKVKESLCRQYFLCGYQNPSGQECVNTIQKVKSTLEVSLTLADIIPGSISDVEEVSPENIFCEPEVNYKMNYGSGKYDGHITIKRVEADAFETSFVTGFTGEDGEAELLWNKCHALYGHYRMKTKPPAEMTECPWIRTLADAKAYLDNWLSWMGAYSEDGSAGLVAVKKRISFRVPYELATTIGATHAPWFPSMHFDLTLPHQTGNTTMQGIIEEINFDVNSMDATVSAVLYDVESDFDFYWLDSYYTKAEQAGNGEDVQESYSTKAEAPTNANDVQDSY